MLYFGGGEGEDIIEKYKLGWIAKPSNYEDLNRVILKLDISKLQSENRSKIQEIAFNNFDFNNQLKELIKHL